MTPEIAHLIRRIEQSDARIMARLDQLGQQLDELLFHLQQPTQPKDTERQLQ